MIGVALDNPADILASPEEGVDHLRVPLSAGPGMEDLVDLLVIPALVKAPLLLCDREPSFGVIEHAACTRKSRCRCSDFPRWRPTANPLFFLPTQPRHRPLRTPLPERGQISTCTGNASAYNGRVYMYLALTRFGDSTIPGNSMSLQHELPLNLGVEEYTARPVSQFVPERIVLAKGSNTTEARRRLVAGICGVYPNADILEAYDTPHNRVRLGPSDPLGLHYEGKRTLVLAEHNSAVRQSSEAENSCPNYWHFSPYGFCPYGCDYCYLARTQERAAATAGAASNAVSRPAAVVLALPGTLAKMVVSPVAHRGSGRRHGRSGCTWR